MNIDLMSNVSVILRKLKFDVIIINFLELCYQTKYINNTCEMCCAKIV